MSLRNKLFVSFGTISLLLLAFVFVTVELRVREQVSGDTVAELQQTDAAFVNIGNSYGNGSRDKAPLPPTPPN